VFVLKKIFRHFDGGVIIMKKTFAVALLACAFTKSLLALNCQNATTTVEMKECASADLQKADKALNTTYKKLMAKLDEIAKEKLKKAQKAWIVYRDANAEFSADEMRGGTGEGLLYMSTVTQMTEQREKELAQYLK
jgi:uncharacterized protein YecT (DUF1311 family)